MIRHRSMLACVAIVATVGVGLPGLVAATAGASTEPPPPSAPIDDAAGAPLPDVADPDAGGPTTTTSPVTTDVSADQPSTAQAPTYHDHDRCGRSPSTTQARPPPPPPHRSRTPPPRQRRQRRSRCERARRPRRAPSARPSLLAPSRRRRAPRSQRRPARPARSASPGTPRRSTAVRRHRLRHPTLRQRGLDLDHHRRRSQHLDHVHRERLDEPHPLPLPGLRPQRHRVEPGRQHLHGARSMRSPHRARWWRRRSTCRVSSASRGRRRCPTAGGQSPTTSSNDHPTARPGGRRSPTAPASPRPTP